MVYLNTSLEPLTQYTDIKELVDCFVASCLLCLGT